MSSVIILWHPSPERFAESAREDAEVFLVLPSPRDARLFDGPLSRARVSLVMDARPIHAIDYGLLRRMQRNRWTLALCHSTDDLARGSHDALERAIEVTQKFRIDVDFLLTLPSEDLDAGDAVRLCDFLASNAVRRVSFAYPLLLSRIGLQPAAAHSHDFSEAFFETWLARGRPFIVDDVHRLAHKLEARNPTVTFLDAPFGRYEADGPIAELLSPGAAQHSRDRCARACEYYLVCGGDVYGAKALFNGTLDSSDNPYCALVAKPLFARVLAQAAS